MAQLDVSVALTNPYTLSRYDLYRRAEVVDNNGRGKTAVTITRNKRAVIYPDGQNTMDRRPEVQSAVKSISIIGIFKLHTAAEGRLPDKVVWRGDWYECTTMEDYSDYGNGFTKVMAVATAPLQLPVENPGVQA